MKVEDVARELCYKYYFGWMSGHNDLAKILGKTEIDGASVKKKADDSIESFLEEAKKICDSFKGQ